MPRNAEHMFFYLLFYFKVHLKFNRFKRYITIEMSAYVLHINASIYIHFASIHFAYFRPAHLPIKWTHNKNVRAHEFIQNSTAFPVAVSKPVRNVIIKSNKNVAHSQREWTNPEFKWCFSTFTREKSWIKLCWTELNVYKVKTKQMKTSAAFYF